MSAIDACRSCGAKDLHSFLDLGDHPLANALLPADRPEPTFPLEVVLCTNCSLVQITEDVPPEVLFRDYIYFSSFSDTMLCHARAAAERYTRERKLGPDSLVAEIASNDGYLLKNFVEFGVPVLGIEPARNIAKVAREAGVRTVSEFFGVDLAKQLVAEGHRADLILANNVIAHAPDINSMIEGARTLLAPGGAFILETPYLKDMLDKIEFDTMYHEHFFCHSLTALEHVFNRHGLAAADVEWIPIHGGTIRVTAVHRGSEGDRPAVLAMLADEADWGVSRPDAYRDFGAKVRALGDDLKALLARLKAEGKRVAAYGAAAKGSTLLNSFGIGRESLDYVVDRSTYKQGKLMPGNHLPIYDPSHLAADRPDYALLLAWNIADEIIAQQEEYRRLGGRFIVPVPEVRIL